MAASFCQEGSDQAAYGEVFLSEDGCAAIPEGAEPAGGSALRVAFYLHFVDPAKALNTSYGHVALPPFGAMPPRLAKLVPYEPVT
jgi:hypothetical protein